MSSHLHIFLTLFYVQPIRQSEECKQVVKFAFQRCLQRVALTDTHGAPYFFRYDNSAEIVDPADNSCCFHSYDLRCFFKIAVILFAEVGNLCRKKSELGWLAFFIGWEVLYEKSVMCIIWYYQ